VTTRKGAIPKGSARDTADCKEEVQSGDDRDSVHRFAPTSHVPFRRMVRRTELRKIVPLADTTIYELEQRGEFPRRFFLTSRCVVWDLAEVETWIDERRRASDAAAVHRAPAPDVRKRKTRPVRHSRRIGTWYS
jgi:prophage regulatory protein